MDRALLGVAAGLRSPGLRCCLSGPHRGRGPPALCESIPACSCGSERLCGPTVCSPRPDQQTKRCSVACIKAPESRIQCGGHFPPKFPGNVSFDGWLSILNLFSLCGVWMHLCITIRGPMSNGDIYNHVNTKSWYHQFFTVWTFSPRDRSNQPVRGCVPTACLVSTTLFIW